jgi:hypothetical protein
VLWQLKLQQPGCYLFVLEKTALDPVERSIPAKHFVANEISHFSANTDFILFHERRIKSSVSVRACLARWAMMASTIC